MIIFLEKVYCELLFHEKLRIIIIDTYLYQFVETLRPRTQWKVITPLHEHLLIGVCNDHSVVRFNEVATFTIKGFQSDAAIATILQFFWDSDVSLYTFVQLTRNLVRLGKLTIFEHTSAKIIKSNEDTPLLYLLLRIDWCEVPLNFHFHDLLNMIHFEFKIEVFRPFPINCVFLFYDRVLLWPLKFVTLVQLPNLDLNL